ncbi:hypothetical protein QBC43DRAFT_214040 [Cladorrhinum sp. PSN259]|nr:hypothetical protein QBC43DRAFT_214040 [Cladorrhinum sp. PSN259]
MYSQRAVIFMSIVLATVPENTAAQILSCADVECPLVEGSNSATCTVADNTFNAVGVADLSTDQNFYLGHPVDFNLGNTSACAVFFSRVSERVRFGDGTQTPQLTKGTCQQALGESCVSALVKRANEVDLNGVTGTEAICEKLQSEFADNLDSECASFATSNQWAGITARALSGSTAPKPITNDVGNSSSNCWPTLPKSNDLRLVESGDAAAAITEPRAQLTCVKAIDMSTATNRTAIPNAGGFHVAGSGSVAMWAGAMSILFAAIMG